MKPRATAVLLSAALAAGTLFADTLVLRSGRRLRGDLIRVDRRSVEFEERSGRVVRFDRDEVAHIELDFAGGSDERDESADERRPSGMRERAVTVDASRSWTDTGIEVRRGQTLYFEASGTVRWGRDRKDGPGGESGTHYNANRPIPNRPGAALIGKVGAEDPFFIGSDTGPLRVRSSGRLSLGINDDYLIDNSGSFRVIVFY